VDKVNRFLGMGCAVMIVLSGEREPMP